MERRWVKVGQFSEPQTAETLGVLNQAGRRILFLEFLLPMQALERPLAERLEKARFSEQQMVEVPGSVRRTQERYFFSMFPSPIQTMERLLAIRAPSSERRMAGRPGHLKSAERRKRSTGFRSPTPTMERSAASNWAGPASFYAQQTEETTGLSRRHIRSLKARTLCMPYHSPMRTPERLLATPA